MSAKKNPNIIFMFCDDCGFNDFGYGQFTDTKTPFIDSLATEQGFQISHHYVAKLCSPSRAAFLTGRYPARLGLHEGIIEPHGVYSLTRQVSLLSNEFQAQGYSTHLIGKWHLGFQAWEYTPTYRGFDTFDGFFNNENTYFSHEYTTVDESHTYYDLRENSNVVTDAQNIYGTEWQAQKAIGIIQKSSETNNPFFLYLAWQAAHGPSEAPDAYLQLYCDTQIADSCDDHAYHQAQLTSLDDNVKLIVEQLKSLNLWSDTLIVFTGDNGASATRGDNAPLRSYKGSPWEGGVRTPTFLTGGYLDSSLYNQQLGDINVHVTDWYPTLLDAANLQVLYSKSKDLRDTEEDPLADSMIDFDIPLDGKSIWSLINNDVQNERGDFVTRHILIGSKNSDCSYSSCGAIIYKNKYKYLRGNNLLLGGNVDGDTWYLDYMKQTDASYVHGCEIAVANDEQQITSLDCLDTSTGCLIDLFNDPCEFYNVADDHPAILKKAQKQLNEYYQQTVTPLSEVSQLRLESTDIDLPSQCIDQADQTATIIKEDNTQTTAYFWCPVDEYSEVTFEQILYEDYQSIYKQADDGVGSSVAPNTNGQSARIIEESDLSLAASFIIFGSALFACIVWYIKYEQYDERNESKVGGLDGHSDIRSLSSECRPHTEIQPLLSK